MTDTNHGVRLADGTFINGTLGAIGNQIEITLTKEVAAEHLLDLMDPEKTKEIKHFIDFLAGTYIGYEFEHMRKDTISGKVNIWLEKKGET